VMMLVFLCRREASTKGWWSATMPVHLWVLIILSQRTF
jgi:hypothetical protein